MTLPWWLADHDWTHVSSVLRRIEMLDRQRYEMQDADIVSRLLRNRYLRGEIESTVIGHDGPISVDVTSNGLTDLGRNLLVEISARAAGAETDGA